MYGIIRAFPQHLQVIIILNLHSIYKTFSFEFRRQTTDV